MLPRKVALHTSSHLTPIEAWQSTVSTTSEGWRVSSEVRLENCMQVWGWAKFGQRATHGWGKIALHMCSELSKLVWTCLNQSAIQWPCTPIAQCHFLHFRMLLFFSLTSYPAEIAYFDSPDRELSNSVQVMALYWNKIVDPSGSPYYSDHVRPSRSHFFALSSALILRSYVLSCWNCIF